MALARGTRRLGARLVVALAVGTVLAGVATSEPAAAARVPLTSTSLLGQSFRTGALTDTFADASGTSLATTKDACGSTWTVNGGTFAITASQTVQSTTNALVTATVPLCDATSVDAEAGGDLRAGSSPNFGVLVHAAAGGRPATAAYYSSANSGSLIIRRISSTGTFTTWASRTGVGATNIVRHLRLVYSAGVYSASINGGTPLTYTPDATTKSAVEANRAVGFVAFSDTGTTFDNFQGFPR